MSWRQNETKFIRVLEQTGLNNNEAKVYLELIKHGIRGVTAYELDHHLDDIKRTTIYSILRKLISIGCVKETNSPDSTTKPTLFLAIDPENYFDELIAKKKREIEFFQGLKDNNLDYFNMMYSSGLEYAIEDVDPFIRPYLKPLLNSGWKISSYYLKEEVPVFGYSIFETMLNPPNYTVYDIMLNPPKFKYLQENSFHLFKFNFIIEQDENAFKFFISSLKKQTKEIISYFSEIKDYIYEEQPIIIYGKEFIGLNLQVKKGDLGNIFENIKNKIRDYWDETDETKHLNPNIELINEDIKVEDYIEVWKGVIIPLKDKIFFLWSESYELLKEMADNIFDVEKIH